MKSTRVCTASTTLGPVSTALLPIQFDPSSLVFTSRLQSPRAFCIVSDTPKPVFPCLKQWHEIHFNCFKD
jgi:hypothetical protein